MKRLTKFTFIALLLPLSSFAGNNIASATGIADSTLLALMIGFILLLLAIVKALAKSIEGISKSESILTLKSSDKAAKVIATIVMLGMPALTFAQNTAGRVSESPFKMSDDLFWLLLSIIIFLAIIIGILFRSLMVLIRLERGESFVEEEDTADVFEKLNLTDNVPIEEEATIMMDHEYDGIRELDNNLPPWWKYMFYATIIFGIVYIVRYHITGQGQLQIAEYQSEIAAAAAEKASFMAEAGETISEDNVTYLADAASIEKGEAIYKGNCATCHGQLGEGGAGPNLTDEYWIHGGGVKNVFKTIKYGVPAKGMIAWQSQFSASQMQKVASYVLTLKGTNPPNGKAPQGEIYVEEEISTDSTETVKVDSTATANL